MKKGYTIEHDKITFKNGVLIVSNYDCFNRVVHYNFKSKEDANLYTIDIGMWRIKQLKQNKNEN